LSSCAPVGNRRFLGVANPPQAASLPHIRAISSLGHGPGSRGHGRTVFRAYHAAVAVKIVSFSTAL